VRFAEPIEKATERSAAGGEAEQIRSQVTKGSGTNV
jgi:hypothetical protein